MNCGGITAPNELEFKYIVLGILTLRLSEDWCRGMGRRALPPDLRAAETEAAPRAAWLRWASGRAGDVPGGPEPECGLSGAR